MLPNARDSLPALSIQHMEEVLGDRVFVDMMGGRQHRLVAAMKSLPLRDDDVPANFSPAERDLVALLTRECSSELDGKKFMLNDARRSLLCRVPSCLDACHSRAKGGGFLPATCGQIANCFGYSSSTGLVCNALRSACCSFTMGY